MKSTLALTVAASAYSQTLRFEGAGANSDYLVQLDDSTGTRILSMGEADTCTKIDGSAVCAGAAFADLETRVTNIETTLADLTTNFCSKTSVCNTAAPTAAPTAYPTAYPTAAPTAAPTASSVKMGCVVVKDGGGSAGQTATATCPSGYELTGGGFHDIDRSGNGNSGDEFTSWPEGNAWFVRMAAEVGGFASYAICCRAEDDNGNQSPTHTLSCSTEHVGGGTNSNALHQSCPAGTWGTGGGFQDIDRNGNGGSAGDEFTLAPDGSGGFNLQHNAEWVGGGFDLKQRCCEYKSTAGASLPLQCRTVVASGDASTPVYATCGSDEMLVGGGFTDIDQNGGGDSNDEFNNCPAFSADGSYSCNDEGSMPSGASWHLRFDDEVGGFTSHATCCKKAVAAR